jgi:hypothetical protein
MRMQTAVLIALLSVTLGCGGDNDAPDDRGPTLSVIGTTIRIRCFGGDCFTGVVRGDGLGVVVTRTIGGVAEERRADFPGGRITDVVVETGDGKDVFRMYDHYTSGTLRVSMGGGDDVVDLDDGGATGATSIDLGDGNDRLQSNASFPAQRFRIDAGPGDDEVALNHVPFPNANEVLGGDGTDVLHAPTNLRAHAQRIDGFEDVDFFCPTVDACEEPD